MAHYVICSVCEKRFDRDKEQAVKSGGRRYAHYDCMPDGELVPLPPQKPKKEKKKEDPDLTALKDYIYKLYGDKANWVLIMKQIKDFQNKYNYTLTGMLKSLVWFHEVKGNSPQVSLEKGHGGLGIIPYCYQDSYNYYYSLFVAKSRNDNVDVKAITSKVKEVTINPPQPHIVKRFFNFLNEEDCGE